MKSTYYRQLIIILSLILSSFVYGKAASPVKYHLPSKPNVIIFLIDDLGWNDLGCYGNKFHKTPSIDRLAEEGVRFTDAYSACTVCSPTRAALMTGKYPARLHLTDFISGKNFPWARLRIPEWTKYLPLEEETLAEKLKQCGYSTWHVGKWHLGDDEKFWPENQGFDVNIAGNNRGAPNLGKNEQCNGYFPPYCLPRIENGPKDEYLTDRLTDEAIKLIKERKDNPFFLNLAHYAVHIPLQAKDDKIKKYREIAEKSDTNFNVEYAAMIESVDESVHKILNTLKEENLIENTLIIFASDNGAFQGVTSNNPLREGKGWAYEGGIRTPLILYWKGYIEGGKEIHEPVITMDIFSTILDVNSLEQSNDIDGKSLLPVVLNNQSYNRPLFWHYPHYHKGKPHSIIRLANWKLIQFFENNQFELYNLKEDIGEQNNLISKNPAKAKELKEILFTWQKKTGAQFPLPNPDYDPLKEEKQVK